MLTSLLLLFLFRRWFLSRKEREAVLDTPKANPATPAASPVPFGAGLAVHLAQHGVD